MVTIQIERLQEDDVTTETAHSLVTRIMKTIRTQYQSAKLPEWNPTQCDIYFEDSMLPDGRPYFLPLIILRTKPCSWLLRSGGCTTCNYQFVAALSDRSVTDEQIISQTKWALEKLRPLERYPYIHISSAGSFLDPTEISDQVLVRICQLFDEAGVQILGFETRPEYLLNKRRLKLVRDGFSRSFAVGVGLESVNDFIRNVCFNKGFEIDLFVKAVQALRDHDMEFFSYVLLGKPFLTVAEDVQDAVETIRFSLQQGGLALLMVANLQEYTLTHWLWERNEYKLPKLWAAIRVLEMLEPEERMKVAIKAIDKAVPPPKAFAANCPNCTSIVSNAIVGWDLTGDYGLIERVQNCCDCKKEWNVEFDSKPVLPLENRVTEALARMMPEVLARFGETAS